MNQRIIKFRVWDKYNKQWLLDSDAHYIGNSKVFGYELEYCRDFLIIQQFTGLKDKNGKEIYEGDIIKISNTRQDAGGKNGIYQVEYYNGSYWVGGLNCMSSYILRSQIFEIVGNIFENPELLKQK